MLVLLGVLLHRARSVAPRRCGDEQGDAEGAALLAELRQTPKELQEAHETILQLEPVAADRRDSGEENTVTRTLAKLETRSDNDADPAVIGISRSRLPIAYHVATPLLYRGSKESRSGALMRIMGISKMLNGWRFRAKHLRGAANTPAAGIFRWNRGDIALNLHSLRPNVRGRSSSSEKQYGSHFRSLGIELVGNSVAQSSQQTWETGFRSWEVFCGLIGREVFFGTDTWAEEMT